MFILCAVLVSSVALINAEQTTTPDYREKYDHLLMQMINERIHSGEAFLEHLSHEVKEWQLTHNAQKKESIIKELEFIIPMVKGADQYFETELKKTGLDLQERYSIEKAKVTADLITKLLAQVQQEVTKKTLMSLFVATTQAPVDYRKEYDRLLYQTIREHIARGEGALLNLNRQLDEYTKTKSKEVKERITREVEVVVPLLKVAEEHSSGQLKRTDLNHVERFLYEKAADETQLLLKHFQRVQAEISKMF